MRKLASFTAVAFAAAAIVLATQTALYACPFCTQGKGPTLIGDFNEAKMVLLGKFANPKRSVGDDIFSGTTDFKIDFVFKDHPVRGKKKKVVLPLYRKPTRTQFVIFCDIYKGAIDPYRGVPVEPGGELVEYLKGAVKLKDSNIEKRLKYCFDWLNSDDFEVAMDAYREYAKADYNDYQKIAESFDADKLVEWLTDPETPPFRYGLYSSLLGHCGEKKHIDVLRDMLDDPKKRNSSGIDGMFAGYVFLLDKYKQSDKAKEFLASVLKDGDQEFLMRWTALRTLRFLWYNRPDILSKAEITKTVALALEHRDMADFAIEDMRKWKRWEMTEPVLELFDKKTHQAAVIKRSILRFALQCPLPAAKQFVREQTKKNSEWVEETRELLELELGLSG